jgi:hypothetical protein
VDHESDSVLGVVGGYLGLGGESTDCMFSVCDPALSNEPVWTFGREVGADGERERPDPLKSIRRCMAT